MFFNQDILLFKNGSLALIWMAGNEEFKNKREKGRRNKEFQAMMKANVVTVCKDLRALFPNMGSAYGLSLKKMGTLVKGLGIIYSFQIDELARDISQVSIALKRPVTLATHQIDVPRNPKSKTTVGKGKQGDAAGDNVALDGGFEEGIPENFGELDLGESVFGTPRAVPSRLSDRGDGGRASRVLFTPPRGAAAEDEEEVETRHRRPRSAQKRRRDEDNEEALHREVCRKLQSGIDENPDAHCMRDDDNPLAGDNGGTGHNDFDFGDGMDLLGPAADLLNGDMPEPGAGGEMEGQPLQSPPAEPMGPPSGLDLEDPSKQLQTPPGAGTRAENTRKRRNEGQEADVTAMELGDVDEENSQQRRIRTARKSLRLMVDSRTNFSLEDMMHQMNTLKSATTVDKLEQQLEMTRAPGKSQWKFFIPGKVDNFIRSAGRVYQSRALNQMVQEILENQSEKPEKASFGSDASMEAQRDAGDGSTVAGISVSSVLPNGNRRSTTDMHLEPEPQGSAPLEEDAGHQFPGVDVGEGFGDVGQFDVDMDVGPEPFQVPGEPRRRRKSREARLNEEQSNLADRLDEFSTFGDLYPPRKVNKKRAAMAFAMLLKMQAKKEVHLHEEEPYGQIRIERLAPLSQ